MDTRRNAGRTKTQPRQTTRLHQQETQPTIDESREPNTRSRCDQRYRVLVALPDQLPVTDAELDLLERELGPFFAEMLKTSD